MKKIMKIFMVILSGYLIYAFIFTIIIFVFNNPNAKVKPESFSDNFQNKNTRTKDRVQLIESAEDGAMVRINLIENAKDSIDISYYTFRNGKVSKIILGSILDAAERGVQVRILLDSLSVLPTLNGEFKDILYGLEAHENINLKFYDPIHPLFPFNWNRRLHDKMIIVDDNLALIGGRNIADNYYIKNTKWRSFSDDRDVIIFKDESLGKHHSVIRDMKDYYEKTWNYRYSKSFIRKLGSRGKTKSNLALDNLKIENARLKNVHEKTTKKVNWKDHTIAVDNINFVHNPVGQINQDPWCLKELLFLSSQAKESIFIQSPYVIPTRKMKNDFNQYDIDLEKTKILTNSNYSSPNYFAISAYSNHKNKMIDNDVRIYEYQGEGSLHGKSYIFDDSISVIGSFNLDARSSYINSETMVVIFSEEFAEKLKKNIQIDLDQSLEVNKDYSYISNENVDKGKVSKAKKIIIAILSKITPILEHLL